MRKPFIYLIIIITGCMMMLSGCGLPIPKKTSLPKTTHNSDSIIELNKLQENDIPFYFAGDDKVVVVKCNES